MKDAIHRMTYGEDGDSRSDAATRVIDYGREATVVMPGAPGRPASSPSIPSGPTMPAMLATPVVELDAAQLGPLFLDAPPAAPPRYAPVRRNAAMAATVSSRTPSALPRSRPSAALILATAIGLPVIAGVVGAIILTLYF